MTADRDTLVVIPALNEAQGLPRVIAALNSQCPDFDVIVIDDGSTDDTAQVSVRLGVGVARLPFNLGVGGALRTGFRYAERCGYQRVIQFDGDGQHQASAISALTERLDQGADMVVGSRFQEASGSYRVGRIRGVAIKILGAITSMLMKQRFTDTSSGFRAFGPRAIALFSRNYPRDYLSDTVEALLVAGYNGLRVDEVHVHMQDRETGTPSARNFMLVYHYLRLLLVITVTASLSGRRRRPEGIASR